MSVVPKIPPEVIAKHADKQSADDAVARRALERYAAIRETIIGWAEAGQLHTAYQDGDTGAMIEIPRELWNVDNLAQRFATCRLRLREYDPSRRGVVSAPIFMNAAQFASLAGKLDSPGQRGVKITAGAEAQCKVWLEEQFVRDPDALISKEAYSKRALERFPSLSGRGFVRVWGSLASGTNRSAAGAKSKQRDD